jgi:hypothetical protein
VQVVLVNAQGYAHHTVWLAPHLVKATAIAHVLLLRSSSLCARRQEEWWLECGGATNGTRKIYHSINAEVRGEAGILLTCESAQGCWVHVRSTTAPTTASPAFLPNSGSSCFHCTAGVVGGQDSVPLGEGRVLEPKPPLGVVIAQPSLHSLIRLTPICRYLTHTPVHNILFSRWSISTLYCVVLINHQHGPNHLSLINHMTGAAGSLCYVSTSYTAQPATTYAPSSLSGVWHMHHPAHESLERQCSAMLRLLTTSHQR